MFKCSLLDRRDVLQFIQSEQRSKRVTPSTREIQEHFGFASQTSVMQYLAALERKGFLQRHARKARALVTAAPQSQVVDIPIYGEIPAGMAIVELSKMSRVTSRSIPIRSMPRKAHGCSLCE